MIRFVLKFFDETQNLARAVAAGSRRALHKAAFRIRKSAIRSIDTSPRPSEPGKPIHTRRGLARRAVHYAVNDAGDSAVIGPGASVVGTSLQAHEFGGEYHGDDYPPRPFMGPALDQNRQTIAGGFAGEVHS